MSKQVTTSRPFRVREVPTSSAVASPVSDTSDDENAGARGLPVACLREDANEYDLVVVRLNDRWRVIEGNCDLQWVLHCRDGLRLGRPVRRDRSFCRTRAGLIRSIRDLSGDVDDLSLATVEALPGRFREAPDAQKP